MKVLNDSRDPFSHALYLLGVIRGHWDYKNQKTLMDFGLDELNTVNMGLAILTPIQKVLDIINGEECKRERRKMDRLIDQT